MLIKTKELVIDFRKSKVAPSPVRIKGAQAEHVETCKHFRDRSRDALR